VLVKTPDRSGYRPAHVDPKAFFAPGRTDWTAVERNSLYGTQDKIFSTGTWINQHDYSAIVLMNPPQDSKPLELSATVVKDRPRSVTLVDPDGKPVVGARSDGMRYETNEEPPLRSAFIPLAGLHPDRVRRIIFIDEHRRLIGFLQARGDGDTPYTVRMQPWTPTVTAHFVDEHGNFRFPLGRIADENGNDLPVGWPEDD
jgi:hypothetical protein